MNAPQLPVSEDELHALADGELADDRRDEVETWLANHPEDAARVAAWHAQAELIRQRYGGVADEPVPARFGLERVLRAQRPWRRWAAAAALVAFVAGGLAGWFGRGAWDGGPLVKSITAEAMDAHKLYVVEVRHPVEVPGEDAAHLQQWLSRRIEHQLRAPDLAPLGLKLVGGRLLPGPKGAAAFFMYEGASGERFTLYCSRAAAPDTALRFRAAGSVAAFYWTERDFGYVVSGPADRDRLQKIAETAYEQLESRTPGTDRSPGRSTLLVQ
jgi:anti-sigma factor RsiW